LLRRGRPLNGPYPRRQRNQKCVPRQLGAIGRRARLAPPEACKITCVQHIEPSRLDQSTRDRFGARIVTENRHRDPSPSGLPLSVKVWARAAFNVLTTRVPELLHLPDAFRHACIDVGDLNAKLRIIAGRVDHHDIRLHAGKSLQVWDLDEGDRYYDGFDIFYGVLDRYRYRTGLSAYSRMPSGPLSVTSSIACPAAASLLTILPPL
jgi:hypothetical protein